eukprot:TRINITY_DN15821_c0_g2_i1.p1 TRINITY_DN15821_c0_g2~~TRINITY_DN15821_c0_g2_i1.p1  ORF type:complete len:350 (-),score=58.33 TRINITY_DN15821_c0_g2_i1:313-1362(-)
MGFGACVNEQDHALRMEEPFSDRVEQIISSKEQCDMPTQDSQCIAVTTSSFGVYDNEPLELLEKAGFKYRLNPYGRKLTEEEAIETLAGCVGVVAGVEPLTDRVLRALPLLKVISRCGSGMDNIDHDVARELGIAVVNTPYGATQATAEMVVGMIMAMLRQIPAMDRQLRDGVWKKRMGNLIAGKQVGIVGLGRIGSVVAALLTGLGCDVRYSDLYVESDTYARMELDALLQWADIISLNCSITEDSSPLMSTDELAMMKDGGWLVNCSRGDFVDEQALFQALKTGKLSGAALDVYQNEPYNGPLAGLDNVVLTSHASSYALEGRIAMERDAVVNLLKALESRQQEDQQ